MITTFPRARQPIDLEMDMGLEEGVGRFMDADRNVIGHFAVPSTRPTPETNYVALSMFDWAAFNAAHGRALP